MSGKSHVKIIGTSGISSFDQEVTNEIAEIMKKFNHFKHGLRKIIEYINESDDTKFNEYKTILDGLGITDAIITNVGQYSGVISDGAEEPVKKSLTKKKKKKRSV